MGKPRNSYESKEVLGQMYREVKLKIDYDKFLSYEFETSILHRYELLPWIAALPILKKVNPLIRLSHEQIVRPFTESVKQLMRDFMILNEAELFCSEISYTAHDQTQIQDNIGDTFASNHDLLERLQLQICEIQNEFKSVFEKLAEQADDRVSVARAIYLATYLHRDNFASQEASRKLP
jgi:hypothetical protein